MNRKRLRLSSSSSSLSSSSSSSLENDEHYYGRPPEPIEAWDPINNPQPGPSNWDPTYNAQSERPSHASDFESYEPLPRRSQRKRTTLDLHPPPPSFSSQGLKRKRRPRQPRTEGDTFCEMCERTFSSLSNKQRHDRRNVSMVEHYLGL